MVAGVDRHLFVVGAVILACSATMNCAAPRGAEAARPTSRGPAVPLDRALIAGSGVLTATGTARGTKTSSSALGTATATEDATNMLEKDLFTCLFGTSTAVDEHEHGPELPVQAHGPEPQVLPVSHSSSARELPSYPSAV